MNERCHVNRKNFNELLAAVDRVTALQPAACLHDTRFEAPPDCERCAARAHLKEVRERFIKPKAEVPA